MQDTQQISRGNNNRDSMRYVDREKLSPSSKHSDKDKKPVRSTSWLRLGIILIVLLLVFNYLNIFAFYSSSYMESITRMEIDSKIPPNLFITNEDFSTLKGNSKEAFAFFLCNSGTTEDRIDFEYLRVSIYRLQKNIIPESQNQRDVIVMVCQETPFWQYILLKNLKVILVPVLSDDNFRRPFPRSNFWKLTNWDRILLIDTDMFFQDDFITVWDEESAKPKHESENNNNNFLYPHLFAAVSNSLKEDYFDIGFYLLKPSIAHYELMRQLALEDTISKDFQRIERVTLNKLYRRPGPLPWSQLDGSYNFLPNSGSDTFKVIHRNIWKDLSPKLYSDSLRLFNKFYVSMKIECPEVTILPEAQVIINSNSITIANLRLSYGKGRYYAIAIAADDDLTHLYSHEEITVMATEKGTVSAEWTDKPTTLVISGLREFVKYNIYYFASTTIKYAQVTPIYAHRQIEVKN